MKKITTILSLMLIVQITACSGSDPEKTGDKPVNGQIMHLTAESFKKLVWNYDKNPNDWKYEGDLPCIIDFYADWCKPCKMIAPIMEELSVEFKGKIRIYKVNTDQQKELASIFNIRTIPAVLFVPKTGKPQMSVGALPKPTFIQAINEVLLGK
jgi:thioredoxin